MKKSLILLSLLAMLIANSAMANDDVRRGLARAADTPFLQGSYRALVIGNNDYKDPTMTWEPLSTAVNDAQSFSSVLRKEYGFTDVEVMLNATQRDIVLALDRLADRVEENDSVVVFYAGHGFRDEEKSRAYWVPVDAVGQDHTTFIRNSTIRDELDIIGRRAKHTLLISDSCFSGSLLRSGNRGIKARNTGSDLYYEKVAKKKSVQILAAGGVEYVDDNYRNSGHSPFTYFLLNELKSNNTQFMTATELATYVEKAVANNVQQTPESGVLAGTGDELGEFIFKRINIKIEVVAEPKNGAKITQTDIPVIVEPAKVTITQPSRAEVAPAQMDPSGSAMVMFPML